MGMDSLFKRAATAQMCKNHPANWAGKKGTIEPFTSTGRWRRKKKRWFWEIWTVLHLFCYSRDRNHFSGEIYSKCGKTKHCTTLDIISYVASKITITPLHKKWKQVLEVEVGRGSLFCHWRYLSSDLSLSSLHFANCLWSIEIPLIAFDDRAEKRRELFASSQKKKRRKPLSARSKGFLFSRLECTKNHQFLRE